MGEGTQRGRGLAAVRAWAYEIWRFDGRIGRRQFWNGVGLLIISNLVFGVIGAGLVAAGWILALAFSRNLNDFILGFFAFSLLFLSLFALQLYWLLALCAKRWHDLGRSGRCSIGLVAPPAIAFAYMAAEGWDEIDFAVTIVLLVCAVFFVWALVLLGAVKGGSEL